MRKVPCESNGEAVADWLRTLPGSTPNERRGEGQRIALEREAAALEQEDVGLWLSWSAVLRFIAEFARMDGERQPFVGHLLEQEVSTSLAA